MSRTSTVYSRNGRLVVEHPGRLSDMARAALMHQLDQAELDPGRPIVLDGGARIRSIDEDGRVWPSDEHRVVLLWWAFAWGAVVGAPGTLLLAGGGS